MIKLAATASIPLSPDAADFTASYNNSRQSARRGTPRNLQKRTDTPG